EVFASLSAGEEVDLGDDEVFAWHIVRDQVSEETKETIKQAVPKPKKKLTVLLASHDFKFFTEIRRAISNAGHKILIDHWHGHEQHDVEKSKRMLAEADVVFCEWSLGNVRWYSQNKLAGQRLITRFHAHELRTRSLDDADMSRRDTFIFVSPVGIRRAQVRVGIPEEKSVVIVNTFDLSRLARYRPA